MPEWLDWRLWRVVADPRIASGLIEIETLWSLDDLLDANVTLDLLDTAAIPSPATTGLKR